MTYRHLFSRFLEPERLHFAAHSHHLWPDVTAAAQAQAWNDAAELADAKWAHVFEVVIPEAQGHVARVLGLPDPSTVVFAPNTHELVARLVTSLKRPVEIVTTDGEFHSFARQASRWEEAGVAEVRRVPVEPFATFNRRFIEAMTPGTALVYLSQVMFDSGFVVPDPAGIVAAAPPAAEIVIDGYHGFMAVPTDLNAMVDRVFYVSGGYKYAMAGEGACFMHCPNGRVPRPVDTGWYAGFAALEDAGGNVGYATGGGRFWGATFDPSGIYRLNAVQRMLTELGITVDAIHRHVGRLQSRFIEGLGSSSALGKLIPGVDEVADRGHFLTYEGEAAGLQEDLAAGGVVTDRRGNRLRIGFGLYHEPSDVDTLLEVVARL